jgi:hypothetical protein
MRVAVRALRVAMREDFRLEAFRGLEIEVRDEKV